MFKTLTKKSFKTIGHGVTEILFQAQVRAEVINKKKVKKSSAKERRDRKASYPCEYCM